MAKAWRLDAREREQLAEQGFVLRREVFAAPELGEIAGACEALVDRLLEAKRNAKVDVGSYTFELQQELGTMVKWEQANPDLLLGVEPFAHLSPELETWARDARLLDPAKDVVGNGDVDLFTEKLNVKRAHRGGPIVLHQDFPYWKDTTTVAAQVATAMIFVDDARLDNGCLEVVPGSHREGEQARRPIGGFGNLEMDTDAFDVSRLIPLEVPAGSVVFFGPFLVHRSLPNHSGDDRRALLFSYQPAGYPHMLELLRFKPKA